VNVASISRMSWAKAFQSSNTGIQMAEVAIPPQMFHEILRLVAELRPQP
jgi:hypothetical protein